MIRSLTILAFATLSASACMHRAASGAVFDPSVITQDEIDSSHAVTAYEAVHRLRPMMLTPRGAVALGNPNDLPNVYVDEQYYGDATSLRNIAAMTIESIKFYTGSEAQYKYGRGNAAGVIGIHTKH
jgi:hypothetical protein